MGPILSRAETSKVVERTGNPYLSAASCCINGFRVTMEDSHTMTLPNGPEQKRSIFGVFDGHSNDTCSAFVAEHLPPELVKLPVDAPTAAIEDVFIQCDAKYMNDDKGGGTTGAVAIIDAEAGAESPTSYKMTVCNTGDSRVLLIRNNELIFVTDDHKPNNAEERERIEKAGGMVRMNRVDGELAVSRAFGDSVFKRSSTDPRATKVICVPEVTRIALQKDDLLMIACDGVFEANFTNEQVTEFVARMMSGVGRGEKWAEHPIDLGSVAAMVCDQAVRRGSKDNISCMFVRIGADGTGVTKQFGEVSYVPGPPPLRNNNNSRTAFEKMCKMAHFSVGEALKRRFELLKARAQLVPPTYSEMESHAFDLQDTLDIDTEERYFAGGPPADEENVIEWFDELTSS